jgi:putative transposase
MGYRRTPFAPGEWYHCFSRGIDGRIIFQTPEDFQRFQQLLYLANDTQVVDRAVIRDMSHGQILLVPRKAPLVAIGAYCLMSNHPHLIVQEKAEGGISKFMHKLGTAYTMYFNIKNKRIGNLLVKPFRSKHIQDDQYLRRVVQYVHLNPTELFEPGWKNGAVKDMKTLGQKLRGYHNSSLIDYWGTKRPESVILDTEAFGLIKSSLPSLEEVIADTHAYYAEIAGEFSLRKSKASPSIDLN